MMDVFDDHLIKKMMKLETERPVEGWNNDILTVDFYDAQNSTLVVILLCAIEFKFNI